MTIQGRALSLDELSKSVDVVYITHPFYRCLQDEHIRLSLWSCALGSHLLPCLLDRHTLHRPRGHLAEDRIAVFVKRHPEYLGGKAGPWQCLLVDRSMEGSASPLLLLIVAAPPRPRGARRWYHQKLGGLLGSSHV